MIPYILLLTSILRLPIEVRQICIGHLAQCPGYQDARNVNRESYRGFRRFLETSRERQRLTEAQKVFSKEYGGFKRISWEENGQVSQAGKGMLVLEPGMFIEEQFTEKEWALECALHFHFSIAFPHRLVHILQQPEIQNLITATEQYTSLWTKRTTKRTIHMPVWYLSLNQQLWNYIQQFRINRMEFLCYLEQDTSSISDLSDLMDALKWLPNHLDTLVVDLINYWPISFKMTYLDQIVAVRGSLFNVNKVHLRIDCIGSAWDRCADPLVIQTFTSVQSVIPLAIRLHQNLGTSQFSMTFSSVNGLDGIRDSEEVVHISTHKFTYAVKKLTHDAVRFTSTIVPAYLLKD